MIKQIIKMELYYKEESYQIIGKCMEVHNELGHGFLEIVYKDALEILFSQANIYFEREKEYPVYFKGILLKHSFRADFVVYDSVILELKCVKMLNDEGIEYITVHGRTREQMYKEPANWDLVERAVKVSQVPIIGNGDIWQASDIDRMLKATGCHAVMVARGALKSPWMAQDYRRGIQEEAHERIQKIKYFFTEYRTLLENENISMRGLLKQSKSVSRFMLEGMENGEAHRRKLILSQTVPEFFSILENL